MVGFHVVHGVEGVNHVHQNINNQWWQIYYVSR